MRPMKNDRFYKWEDEDLQEVRVVRLQNTETCSVIKTKGNNIGERKKIKISELEENYTKLKADGYVSFNIVTVGKTMQDVMVVISRNKDIIAKKSLPYAVCRQGALDLFAKQLNKDNIDYVGLSVSQDTCPANVEFENFLACNSIDYNETISYYIGDKLSDILYTLKDISIFDNILLTLFRSHCMYLANNNKFIAETYEDKQYVDGYCKKLEDLLRINNFEYDLLTAFDIIPTTLDKEDFGETLSLRGIEILSSILRLQVYKTLVLKYDKDIDLNSIKKSYCLMSDKDNTVYVVAYTISGRYYVPVDGIESEDNLNKLRSVLDTDSIEYAYQHLQFIKEKYE